MALEDEILDSDNASADESDQLRWHWQRLLPRRMVVSIIGLIAFLLAGLLLCLIFWEMYRYWGMYWEDMPWLYYTQLSELLILSGGAAGAFALVFLSARFLIAHAKEARYACGEMPISDFFDVQVRTWRAFAFVFSGISLLAVVLIGFTLYLTFMPMEQITEPFIPEQRVFESPSTADTVDWEMDSL